jgi:hypothetical protein
LTITSTERVKEIPRGESFISLAYLHHKTKETKTKETKPWLEATLGDHQGYILPTTKTPIQRLLKPPNA